MPNEKTKRMIETLYYPFIPRDEIASKCRFKISKDDLVGVGGTIAAIAGEMAKLVISPSSNEGLYRCVFPEGVSGALAQAKDGSGYLGTIMNNGIAGQVSILSGEAFSIRKRWPIKLNVPQGRIS